MFVGDSGALIVFILSTLDDMISIYLHYTYREEFWRFAQGLAFDRAEFFSVLKPGRNTMMTSIRGIWATPKSVKIY